MKHDLPDPTADALRSAAAAMENRRAYRGPLKTRNQWMSELFASHGKRWPEDSKLQGTMFGYRPDEPNEPLIPNPSY